MRESFFISLHPAKPAGSVGEVFPGSTVYGRSLPELANDFKLLGKALVLDAAEQFPDSGVGLSA